MMRCHGLATGIFWVGLSVVCACSRDDASVASTTTTTSAITPARKVSRARPELPSVYEPEREPIRRDRAVTTIMAPAVPVRAAVPPPVTPAGTPTAPRDGERVTAPSPVGPGGFAAAPLDPASGFVPGTLDPAAGFGPTRIDPSRAFTPAPLDTSFRGPDVVEGDATGRPMGHSGPSMPGTMSTAGPSR